MAVAVRASLEPHETNCGTIVSICGTLSESPSGSSGDLFTPRAPVGSMPVPSALSSACCLRHRSWWHDRLRVYRALELAYPDKLRSVRFGSCGANAHVEVSDTDPPEYRLAAEHCRDRWCRPCQRERGRIIAANIVEHLDGGFCRFLTLTIRTRDLSLSDAVHKLYRSFAKLRQTVWWRSRVTGGCATCEIKRTRDGLGWHPHLHLLVQGEYLPQGWLAKKWLAITGDSYIVDIFAVQDGVKAARYVTKYLSKPVPASIVRNPDDLLEAIQALTGRHLVLTFGSWRGLKLTHTESPAAWTQLCTYRELVDKASAGETESRRILSHLLGQHGLDPTSLDTWLRESLALHKAYILACQLDLPLTG